MTSPDQGETPARAPLAGPPRGVGAMAVLRWVIVVVAAIVAAVTIWHFARRGGAPASAQQAYHCPMHPSVVQDHPGQCPICGMTLVPSAPAGSAAPPAASSATPPGLVPVELTPERIQLVGMKTATVQRRPLNGTLRTVGVVEANERGLAQVSLRFSGWVQKLFIATMGERVRRGQVLATIYSPDVLRAEQELLVASGWTAATPEHPAASHDAPLAGLETDARRRLELLGIDPQEIDQILLSRKPAEAIAIRSPVDGFVIAKDAVAGLAVQPGSVLFQVADLSTVWITAQVYEQDLSRVHVGAVARFEPSAYPGEVHAGKVQFVYPTLQPASQALMIRIELRNRFDRAGPRLRPGMSGTVRLDVSETTGLVVPADAVVDTGDRHYVFVAMAKGRFEPRSVQLGRRMDDQIELLSGVAAGDQVVTTGNFLIDSESRLRAAIEGQSPPGR